MRNLWYIHGPKAGTFESLNDDAEAQRLIDEDIAQECDGVTALRYPENHPHYGKDVAPKKKAAKKKVSPRKRYETKVVKPEGDD